MTRARRMSDADVLMVRATLRMAAIRARAQVCEARPGSVEHDVCMFRFEEARDTLHRFERHSMLKPTVIESVEVPA